MTRPFRAGLLTALSAPRKVNPNEFISGKPASTDRASVYIPTCLSVTDTSSRLRASDHPGIAHENVGGLSDALAEVWHFPPWFGRNIDAFDDFMRDLDNMIDTASGKPPAPGYFTHITDSHLILADQPDAFSWFAKCMPFYRDYYRDEASPPAAFGLLLSAPPDRLREVRERWLTADVLVVSVET